MNVLKTLLLHTRDWINDPFKRKELLQTHDEVLGRMRETHAAVTIISSERFPIAKMVGSPKPAPRRRDAHHDR